jgi:hypothetical protein
MQHHVVDSLLTELRSLIHDLGQDGGLIGPSIYDTAQVIRLAPPASGVQQTLHWLVAQQQPDGGWGNPAFPRARDMPTLAALLALHLYAITPHDRRIIQAGLDFLRQHAPIWEGSLPDDLPVGIELLLPRMLEEAQSAGLCVPRAPYAALIALGERRRRLLAALPIRAGTPPAHVWEGWGTDPDPNLIDASGGVGHSPAATAAWLRASVRRADLVPARAAAHRYLERAAAATATGIPGVVPTAWPIPHFEASFALYFLLVGGLLDHPGVHDVLRPRLDELAGALRPGGLGFSDHFIPDGDDTAAAIAVLQAAGYRVDSTVIEQFAHDQHFCAYVGELQPSLSVTAHAAHALALSNGASRRGYTSLLARQLPDGRWCDDKWNGSWLYTTSQVLIALLESPAQYNAPIRRVVDALLFHQHSDGGWGVQSSTLEETAYGVLALRTLIRHEIGNPLVAAALERADQWMITHYRPSQRAQDTIWLAKENYRPQRIVRMLELVATFPSTELSLPLQMSQSVGGARSIALVEQARTLGA